ncbi:hypothetical protein DCAR_0102386 [Daucus carota subsp. sativus]|uniref:CCT domain-containing protein n=1 Tax=Daucus carota subsp. sativus TaxID=79200 RepID=A0AAF0W4S3_DAUCS|nr:hypothetical protein DCAR_0102386 [Daucus carota subsp. sativus]
MCYELIYCSVMQQEISSPLSAQILEFCESELFPETLQNSEVASSSNCCYEEHSSYTTNVPFNTPEVSKLSDSIANNVTRKPFSNAPPPMSAENNTNTSNLSIIFDSAEDFDNDISASIDFSSSPTALSSQHLVNGGANATPLASEITSLEDSTFKVGKLSAEERKEKIHRYMKKRNERNFSKKIKYACRKTLADSRPRVRGRFAKNDDFGDPTRTTSSTHEEDTDEDVRSIRVCTNHKNTNTHFK